MLDHDLEPAMLPELERAAAAAMMSVNAWYLVAASNTGIVGSLQMNERFSTWSGSPYCYVEDFCVTPAWRGKGVGGQLLDEVASWARSRGWARIDLDVSTKLPDSIRFYSKHGFVATGSVLLRRETVHS